jgi:hypothetical protein
MAVGNKIHSKNLLGVNRKKTSKKKRNGKWMPKNNDRRMLCVSSEDVNKKRKNCVSNKKKPCDVNKKRLCDVNEKKLCDVNKKMLCDGNKKKVCDGDRCNNNRCSSS